MNNYVSYNYIKRREKIKAEKLKNKKKPRTKKAYEETIQLPPSLLQGGTKPLLIDQEDF